MKKDEVFKLRLSAEDREIMEKLAELHGISVAGLVRMLVRGAWGKRK